MDPTLHKLQLINFGLIQFSTIPGMKSRSCPSRFLLFFVFFLTTKGSQEQFPGEKAIPKCSALAFVRLFVAAMTTVYQEPHLRRTEGQELFHFCLTKNFRV